MYVGAGTESVFSPALPSSLCCHLFSPSWGKRGRVGEGVKDSLGTVNISTRFEEWTHFRIGDVMGTTGDTMVSDSQWLHLYTYIHTHANASKHTETYMFMYSYSSVPQRMSRPFFTLKQGAAADWQLYPLCPCVPEALAVIGRGTPRVSYFWKDLLVPSIGPCI